MYDVMSDEARAVVLMANLSAHDFRHNYLGTEHLLMGLLGGPYGQAGEVTALLNSYGITRGAVAEQLGRRAGFGHDYRPGTRPLSPRARRLLEKANHTAFKGGRATRIDDIFDAVLSDPESAATLMIQSIVGTDGWTALRNREKGKSMEPKLGREDRTKLVQMVLQAKPHEPADVLTETCAALERYITGGSVGG